MKAALAALVLAGCTGLIQTTTSGTTARPGSPAGGTGAAGAEAAAAPDGAAAGDDVIVPDLLGKTREEAAALVAAAGFSHGVESTRPVECVDAARVEGRVDCQDPPPGQRVKRYTLVQINVYRAPRVAGAVVRAQLEALVGLTPAAARARLASYGHDGEVKVAPGLQYDARCGRDVVCEVSSSSGVGLHDPITLYVNPGLAISAPPP